MKTSLLAAVKAASLAMCLLVANRASAQTDPSVPVGNLSAYPTIVRTGTYPTLTWGITYPQIITDIVNIGSDGTVTTKVQPLTMDVRVLGSSVIVANLDYYGNVTSSYYIPVYCKFAYAGGAWTQIWTGKMTDVNPATIVLTKTITSANAALDFGAQYYWPNNNSYGTFFNTINNTNSNRNILALKNGDYPPTTYPLYQQPTLASYLKPYLDSTGHVVIGPKDIIYLFELTHTNPADDGFDIQDLVLLCTFR